MAIFHLNHHRGNRRKIQIECFNPVKVGICHAFNTSIICIGGISLNNLILNDSFINIQYIFQVGFNIIVVVWYRIFFHIVDWISEISTCGPIGILFGFECFVSKTLIVLRNIESNHHVVCTSKILVARIIVLASLMLLVQSVFDKTIKFYKVRILWAHILRLCERL